MNVYATFYIIIKICYFRFCEVQSSSSYGAFVAIMESLSAWCSPNRFRNLQLIILELALIHFFSSFAVSLIFGFIYFGFSSRLWICQSAQLGILGGGLALVMAFLGVIVTWVRLGLSLPK